MTACDYHCTFNSGDVAEYDPLDEFSRLPRFVFWAEVDPQSREKFVISQDGEDSFDVTVNAAEVDYALVKEAIASALQKPLTEVKIALPPGMRMPELHSTNGEYRFIGPEAELEFQAEWRALLHRVTDRL